MQSFLNKLVHDSLQPPVELSKYTFILPSKRACLFLKHEFKDAITTTAMLPRIISIEEYITDLSGLQNIDTTSLLFEFYTVYKSVHKEGPIDTFENFSKWARLLLQDFNEIDKYLIDQDYIFGYLKDIKRLEELLKGEKKTSLIDNQMLFFEKLQPYYRSLYDHLLQKKMGYQGIQYREAVENIHFFIDNNAGEKFVFAGFNALNKAEETIINQLLDADLAKIYWDIDTFYLSQDHNASFFIKQYQKNWNYYKNHPFQWPADDFSKSKNIKIIGTPKKTTQIKAAGELLSKIYKNSENFQNTAMVLLDESLLSPTLNSLPHQVNLVNITMGYELKNIPISNVFEQFFKLHIHAKGQRFYFKHLLSLINQASFNRLFKNSSLSQTLEVNITARNYIYLTKNDLLKFAGQEVKQLENISFLFEDKNQQPTVFIENCILLIGLLKGDPKIDPLEKEYLYRFYQIFQQLLTLNNEFGYLDNLKITHQFYNQILKNEKLFFKGEPLSGLQILGMLETRVLDFKNLVLCSANEGLLPAGKSDSSFIPFDIKKELGLPTYQEKDAIFSYHFFRLIQRAENIYLFYNTETDKFGSGEQSRFLTQLEIYKENEVEKMIISPPVNNHTIALKSIVKNDALYKALKEQANKGFSATAMTNYILDPFGFYTQKILKINELEEVEETIAANTLGTVVHKTLEALYLPFKGKVLTIEMMSSIKPCIVKTVTKYFKEEFGQGPIDLGKNLLINTVAQQFVTNFIDQELAAVKQGKQIEILELEFDLQITFMVEGLDFPIKLIGQADRIDQCNGVTRIIDFKTGKVEQTQLNIKDWSLIAQDYKKYSKSFQVLFYALLFVKSNDINLNTYPLESGIISFKNLNKGFLKVNNKLISSEELTNFTTQLKKLLLELFNREIPILEKETEFKK